MPCVGQSLNKAANEADGMACLLLPVARLASRKKSGGLSRSQVLHQLSPNELSLPRVVGKWQRVNVRDGRRQRKTRLPPKRNAKKECDSRFEIHPRFSPRGVTKMGFDPYIEFRHAQRAHLWSRLHTVSFSPVLEPPTNAVISPLQRLYCVLPSDT